MRQRIITHYLVTWLAFHSKFSGLGNRPSNAQQQPTPGVKRDASPTQIKKAFRRKARQLHPDKNPDKEDEYVAVNTAYTVLSDADKRRQYDQLGHSRFVDSEKGGGQQHHHGGFNRGFGGFGGGGQQFNFDFGGAGGFFKNFGGFGGGHHRQQQQRRVPLFSSQDSEVTLLTDALFKQHVRQTDEVWLIMFFSDSCQHCHTTAPHLERVAKKLHNIVNIGAVNCGSSRKACKSVTGYPTIVLFTGDEPVPRSFDDALLYRGKRTDAAMVRWIIQNVPSNVDYISTFREFDNLVLSQKDFLKVPTVTLVSSKKPISPIFDAISRDHSKDFDFVFVSAAESTDELDKLLKHLNVDKEQDLPILIISNYVIPGAKQQRFKDDLGYERMSEILSTYARAMEQLKSGGGKIKKSYEDTSVIELTADTFASLCPARGGVLCVLALGSSLPMQRLAATFKKDRFKFARISDHLFFRFQDILDLQDPALVVLNAKRERVATRAGESFDEAKMFLDNILGGGGTWKNVDVHELLDIQPEVEMEEELDE